MNNGRIAQNGNVIVINDLVKKYGDVTAVNGLNLWKSARESSLDF